MSLLSERIAKQWSKKDQESVTRTDMKVQLADSKALTVSGEVVAEVQLAGEAVRHKFIVASIGNDVLLGLDFLREENCVIDVTRKCLEWGRMVLPLWETAER